MISSLFLNFKCACKSQSPNCCMRTLTCTLMLPSRTEGCAHENATECMVHSVEQICCSKTRAGKIREQMQIVTCEANSLERSVFNTGFQDTACEQDTASTKARKPDYHAVLEGKANGAEKITAPIPSATIGPPAIAALHPVHHFKERMAHTALPTFS